ncbi:putative PEP-CTERM system TPR-repeat lipoprotein [Nitrosomonas cryotolerans]|uniref:Putative PEP-CTERM system TPR-repeat lipoprotein n=1 Tax=Nitrosomonas cryotolerans ATCC 49181 TaxID=1131553 RepID=A0A1N6J5L1_9PROT|nr:XrtA/PEP-CTERM system TPR-repeat protein PrsT [Nitrosomonas cryotolerans]SFP45877.1 putative PEP-CTERM system TPR-repeat lipoprotein [Nitrosomonas cryotolerans]SIO39577.1 putative PEP-CTERM system TPR-repeat lipoprotein [Nitrosomonas cryotolerans ATCC 49181]
MRSINISIFRKNLFTILIPILLISGSLVACSEAKDTQVLISEATQYQQSGNDKAAIIQLKNALQQDPDNSEARYLLGTIYNQTGDHKAAEKELSRALRLGSDPGKVLPDLGKVLFNLGEFQQLLDKTEMLSATNNPTELLLLRGNAFLALGKYQDARNVFEQILKKEPDSPGALIGLANYSLSEKNPEMTIKFSEQAITKNPDNADAWFFKADLLRAQGKIEQALAAYNQVIQLEPGYFSAYINRAIIEIGTREFDAAAKSIDAARKISSNALSVIYTQALLDFSQGRQSDALASTQQILNVAPEHLPSILLAGAAQFSLGSLLQAEQYLEKYLKRIPGNLYARKLMVAILLKSNQTQQAINILTPTLDIVQEDPQLLALAGEAYMQAKDFTKATAYLEKANELAPDNATLHTALGMSKLALGDSNHAIAELELAKNLDTASPRAAILLTLTHLRLKEFDKALSTVKVLEKEEPDNPLYKNLKGGIYLGKQDFSNARISFNRALSIQSDYFPAIKNLARLDIQEKNPDAAKKRFEAILKKDEKNIQAMNALADLAQSQGNINEATNWLELASSKNPNAMEPAIQLATHYLHLGEKKKSLTLAQKLYGTYPNQPSVLETLGQAQFANGNQSAALESYERLAVNLPKSAAAQLKIATIHAAMQNQSAASIALKKALKMQPDYLDAQVLQFRLAVQNKNENEAFSISQKIQKEHNQLPIGYILEGDLLMGQKKPERALKAYEQAFLIAPSSPLIVKLHATLSQTGKEKEANSRLNQWLNKYPGDSIARLYLAENYLEKQQFDAAVQEYQSILKQYPEHTSTLNNLAWLYQQEKDPRALAYAERAYKQAPNSPAILDTLGWILVGEGNITRALPLLEKAAFLAPEASEIQYHHAFGLVKSGDRTKARDILEKLLVSDKNFPRFNDAQALLKQVQ